MSLPHDIAGRARMCPCPVDWLITYLGDCEGTRHSEGGRKPEYDGFDDGRPDIVKFYDIGYPRSSPSYIAIDEGNAPHAKWSGST
jgi:hypothetical protein